MLRKNLDFIQTFNTLQEALRSILKLDTEFRVVTHRLSKGEKIKNHYHPNTSEWVILNEGSVKFLYAKKWYRVKPDKGKVFVVSIPPKVIHGLISETSIKYFVVRDKEADTIYK